MRLVARGQREPIGSAVDRQRDHHGSGKFAETVARGFIKMAGSTSRADVINVFRNDQKKKITRAKREKSFPPREICKALRHDREYCHTEQRSCAETDERAKSPV